MKGGRSQGRKRRERRMAGKGKGDRDDLRQDAASRSGVAAVALRWPKRKGGGGGGWRRGAENDGGLEGKAWKTEGNW